MIEFGLSFRRKGWWKPFSDSLSLSDEILDSSPRASDFERDLQKSEEKFEFYFTKRNIKIVH